MSKSRRYEPTIAKDKKLRIAMLGTRGVPASYGGFETAVEEIGHRLAALGHEVVVYCRNDPTSAGRTYRGMTLRHLAALSSKTLETPSHTAMSAVSMLAEERFDAAFVFNSANSPFVPLIRLRANGVAVHVDGIEWRRSKWGKVGRRFYRFAEGFAVRSADALIADAEGIADYYLSEFGAATELLTYGAKILEGPGHSGLASLGVEPQEYHLVVARFEPENHVHLIVEGYRASSSRRPLVVVGAAAYGQAYTESIHELAAGDSRIRFVGRVDDQDRLDQIYANAFTYIHGHSVGGTNPSLLRAMGAGTAVLSYDVSFNREVTAQSTGYWSTAEDLAQLLDQADQMPDDVIREGPRLRTRAKEVYDWDEVTAGYEDLALRLSCRAGSRQRTLRRRPGRENRRRRLERLIGLGTDER